jgi:hypothetical protein
MSTSTRPPILDPLKGDGRQWAQTAREAVGNIKHGVEATIDATKAGGGRVASMALAPVRAVVKVSRWPVAIVSKAFAKAPVISTVTAGIGAIGLGASWVRGRAEDRTREDITAQALEAQAATQHAYTVTPEEYAAMEARMRGGQGPRTGHADAVLASREAQAQATANAAAL